MIKTWAQVKCRNDIVASENTTFSGRTALFTDEEEITSENIIEVLDSLFFYIYDNYRKIIMLKNYERGMQPISSRKKKVRADINNRVVVNLAHEIKEFKLGFIFGDPVTYVQRGIEDTRSGLNIDPDGRMADQGIAQLNEMMFEQGKASKDIQLANEFCTCGVGYRLIMANEDDDELSPFKIYPLQSETTFVVYSNTVSARKVLSGTFVIKDTGVVKLGCYTDTKYFELEGNLGSWVIVKEENNGIGINPINKFKTDVTAWFNSKLTDFKNFGSEIITKIRDGIGDIWSKVSQKFTDFKNKIKNFFSGLDIFKIKVSYEPTTILGNTVNLPKLSFKASGGYVNSGEAFIARENGMPEMVGRIGNRTAVANNDQIVQAVSNGVFNAIVSAMSMYQNNNTTATDGSLTVVVPLDGEVIYRNVINRHNSSVIMSGKSPLIVGG